MKKSAVIGIVLALAPVGCSGDSATKTNTNTITVPGGTVTVEVPVENADCTDDGVCRLSGVILEDATLTADVQWVLTGGVFVGDDQNETVLTIEPGTVIYGENATRGMLVVTRGSKIVADGTADAPIVFTSSKTPGSRARGDWGGLILNGLAPINNCADGGDGCEQFGEGGTGWFGGTDPEDSSGVLRYVRVEFAGTLISPDNELNGIAFQGVGRGTEIEYIQVHMNADDGIEFFGGTAEFKYALVTGTGDDMFDWTDGWTGKAQFFVGQQYSDSGDNGIEADNNGDDNELTPRSNPLVSNVTLIGSPDSTSSDFGALLREGTAGSLHNMVITGFNQACLSMSQGATLTQVQSGALAMASSLIDCAVLFESNDDNGEISTADIQSWYEGGAGNEAGDPGLIDPFNEASPAFAPTTAAAAATGAVVPADPFFDEVDFRGGVDPANDWTAGWTTAERN